MSYPNILEVQLIASIERARATHIVDKLNNLYYMGRGDNLRCDSVIRMFTELNYSDDTLTHLHILFKRIGGVSIAYLDSEGKAALAYSILNIINNEYIDYSHNTENFFTKFPRAETSLLSKIKSVFKSVK